MNKSKPVALIAAGKLTDSPLSRFRGLADRLGPVKSRSFRLASRIANSLRAGQAVKDYADLNDSRLLLINVPDDMAAAIIFELETSEITWAGKAVVLCSSILDSVELAPLAALGAAVGSIGTISGMDDMWYLVEGDKLAIRESRYVVEHRGRRVLTIERGQKACYLAALTCTSNLLFAVIFAASESLRHAGVGSSLTASILEKQMSRTLRTYLKAGRKAYPDPGELTRQLTCLAETGPAIGDYLRDSVRLAARLLEKR
jgi:predicted short-subunit dehydrogenase-like oxidoreductase (DUF2520 family)